MWDTLGVSVCSAVCVGTHTSGRERVVLSTGYGAANLPYVPSPHSISVRFVCIFLCTRSIYIIRRRYWAEDGGYRPISDAFLAAVPPQLSTLFKGRKSWVRNARYRPGGLSTPLDSRAIDGKTFKLGVWNERPAVSAKAAL